MTEIKNVRLVISQPKVRKAPSEWTCTADELQADTERTAGKAEVVMACLKDPETVKSTVTFLHPGEKQCTYCKAAADCPAYAKTIAQAVFNADDLPVIDPESEEQPEPYVPIYPGLLAARYLTIPLIRKWCERIEARVLDGIKDGTIGKAQGLKPVAGREGNREWSDAEAVEALLKSFKLKQDEMYDFKLISPTKALETLKESPRRLKKLEELIVRKPGSMSVVHVSDKRPPLAIGAYAAADMPDLGEPPPQQPAVVDSGDDLI